MDARPFLRSRILREEVADHAGRVPERSVGEAQPGQVMAEAAHTMAAMLFGFLLFNMTLLYLVNYRDPQIRSYTHKMINATISIFCAVLMNQAVFSVLLVQILPAPFPRGLGMLWLTNNFEHEMHVGVGLVVFLANVAGISVLCWMFRGSGASLHAIKSIAAHLCAFAGITTFGHLMEVSWFKHSLVRACLVPLLAWFTCVAYRFLSMQLRKALAGCVDKESIDSSNPEHSGSEGEVDMECEKENWIEDAMEAEGEFMMLLVSFLVHQCICFYILGKLPVMHGLESPDMLKRGCQVGWVVIFMIVLLIAGTALRAKLEPDEGNTKNTRSMIIKNLQIFTGTELSWLMFRTLDWNMTAHIPRNLELAHTLDAFSAVSLSIVTILILDSIADRVQHHRYKGGLTEGPPDVSQYLDEVGRMFEGRKLEPGIRTIINSLAVFVGLSWEMAFDGAEEAILEAVPTLEAHPVIAKVLLATATATFVLPAWRMFIVPKAQLTEAEHEERIELEMSQAARNRVRQGSTTFDGSRGWLLRSLTA